MKFSRVWTFDLGDPVDLAKALGDSLRAALAVTRFSDFLTSDASRHVFEARASRLPLASAAVLTQAAETWSSVRCGAIRLLPHLFLAGQERVAAEWSGAAPVLCQPDLNLLFPLFGRQQEARAFFVIAPSFRGIRVATVLTAQQVSHDRALYIPILRSVCRDASASPDSRQRDAASLLVDWFRPGLAFPPRLDDFQL